MSRWRARLWCWRYCAFATRHMTECPWSYPGLWAVAEDIVHRLRQRSTAVHLATDADVAGDLSAVMREAADYIEKARYRP